MPVENERKYVLSSITWTDIPTPDQTQYIEQYYLDGNARVRRITNMDRDGNPETPTFHFTFKQKVGEGDKRRTIEIETEISQQDYQALALTAERGLAKRRLKYVIADEHWDVDFLRDPVKNTTYFRIAEVEMPEHRDVPNVIPDFISKHIVYEVPRNLEKNFSNHKLSSRIYAEMLYDYSLRGTVKEFL